MVPAFPRSLPTGTVTFVFTDIEGSTALLSVLGDGYSEVLEQHRRVLRSEFVRCEGVEVGTEGDSFFVAFGRASDAVDAAVAVQRGLAAVAWPNGATVRVRVGVHTGQPTLVADGYVGLDVHRAARIMAAAHGGQVVISQVTRDLVVDGLPDGVGLRDLGEHRLKDLTHPQRLYDIAITGLDQVFPPLRTLENRPTNLPTQPSRLVGRERELAELADLVTSGGCSVITLTGPGGVGKTRLAMQAAAELVEGFRGGVYFVSLAAIDDPELVLPTIAQTVGVSSARGRAVAEGLRAYLAERDMIIVVDNFEHVMDAAPAFAGVAGSAPGVRWLVTSRASLRVAREREYSVLPLTVPTADGGYEDMSRCGAVQLFLERAQAVKAGFELTAKNAPAIASICQELDGLPLALELAAARLRVLPPEALLARLGDRLKVLTGGLRDAPERQQTLRATIGWSHDLLSDHDRSLFARLGVFDGGWTFEAAEQVCGDDGVDVFEGLASLVENSLVGQEESADAGSRFSMLETIRSFAVERLEQFPEGVEVRRRHATYYREIARDVQLAWLSEESYRLMPELNADIANLNRSIEHFIDAGDYETAAAMTGELGWFWQMAMHYEWADGLVDRLLAHRSSLSDRAVGLLQLTGGASALDMTKLDYAEAAFLETVELLERADEIATAAYAAKSLGWIYLARQDPSAAFVWFERASSMANSVGAEAVLFEVEFGFAEIASMRGDAALGGKHVCSGLELAERLGQAFMLYGRLNAGQWELAQGHYDEALAMFEQARQHAVDVRDHRTLPACLLAIATANLLREDIQAATTGLDDLLPRIQERGVPEELGWAMLLTARVAAGAGDANAAASLLGASYALRKRTGGELASPEQTIHDSAQRLTADALGEDGYRSAFELGTQTSVNRTMALATGCLDHDPPDAAVG
jgi:predicted ATPase/class 3 adenylate cyclase